MFELGVAAPLNASMAVQVIRHPTATPAQIIAGEATDGVDLTPYASKVSQTHQEVSIPLAWHMELYDASAQPRVGEWVEIKLNGLPLFNGIIQSIRDYGESRGHRSMTLTVRSRDATPKWRESRVVTQTYPMGTDLISIASDVLDFLGVSSVERVLPTTMGAYTVHSSIQMAEITPWDILTTIGLPVGLEPYVDAIGRFKYISRAVTRPSTHVLAAERVNTVNGGRESPRVTRVLVKWLDPNLTKSAQQDQALDTATITAGFFQLKQEQDVFFSKDRTQRAENTRLVIKQSCNTGLLRVADETYAQLSLTQGRITLKTHSWVPALATVSLAAMIAAGALSDIAPTSGGPTWPVGKIVHAAAEGFILITMMSIGTGVYEVWGAPYDYVHAVNRTEAYDQNAAGWSEVVEEIANDFIMSEDMAQSTAVRELMYRGLSGSSYNMTVVDDTTIEVGDILELPEGSRVYVTGYTRNLERGVSHFLSVDGFFV